MVWPRVSSEAAARWQPGLPPEKDGPGLRDRPPNPLALVVEAGVGPPVGRPSSPPHGSLQRGWSVLTVLTASSRAHDPGVGQKLRFPLLLLGRHTVPWTPHSRGLAEQS